MASSNIKLFDENKGNMLTDTEFNISAQRLNGLQTGVASSQLQNKAMYQASLMAYAIAQVMMQNGLNANDTDAVSTFVANLSGTMLQKVYDIATIEEAKAGVATGKWMSPALVKAAIDALAAKAQNVLSDTTKTLYGLDSSAVPNDVFVKIKQKFSECVNPSLLDNGYFGNPVDQRGGYVVPPGTAYYVPGTWDTADGTTTNYVKVDHFFVDDTGTYPIIIVNGTDRVCNKGTAVRGYTGVGYGIDRWASNSAVVLISSDGVTITGDSVGFRQILNDYKLLSRKTVTLSFLAKERNGLLVISLISGSFRQDFTQDGLFISQTITLPELTAPLECWVYHDAEGTSTLKAAKLELGDQQTLAHQDADGNWMLNEIPNYWEELLKCIQSTADPSDTFANKTVLHTGNAQHLGFPKITIGSYVGTGTAGSPNPNSLTFNLEPKVVIIVQNGYDNFPGTVFIRGQTQSATIGENYISNSQLTVGWSGNTVTWYTGNSSYGARAQLNISGNTYFYIALG